MKSTGQSFFLRGMFLRVVSLVFVLGMFGASASPQMRNRASAAPGTSDFGLAKKHDGGKPRLAAVAGTSVPVAAQPGISAALGHDDSRYAARAVGDGFRAENPQQALAAEFTPQGIEVRTGMARWGLALRGYGYGDALQAANPAAPQASANRVEYRRGALTEWYVNGPLGMEQGFTLAERPGRSQSEPLTIALELSKDVSVLVDASGKGLTLTQGEGRPRLRYAGLVAYDATGRELRSWLEARGFDLLLRVEDAGARYPLVVDPLIQLAKLTASDGAACDLFGLSAISGDGGTVVVGALQAKVGSNFRQGAAYVFLKPGSGWATTSSFVAKLTASDGAGLDAFGSSVAVSDDGGTIVVGAGGATFGSNLHQGAAYVFVKPTSGWTTTSNFTAKLTASDGAGSDELGLSAAVSGDGSTIVAGAGGAKNGSNTFQGAAYVFVKPATGWLTTTDTAKLTASDAAVLDTLGFSVAVSGDGSTVVVGAPFKIGPSGTGAAYVFLKPGSGWATETETAKLTASDPAEFELGFSVAVTSDGGIIVGGAPSTTVGPNLSQGAASVFLKPASGWTTTSSSAAKLTASDGAAFDAFGASVAIRGDGSTIVGGAPTQPGSNPEQGAAYMFLKPGSGWASTSTFTSKLTASDGAANDLFGTPVSISADGGTVVAGAIFANTQQGAAYVFGRSDFSISARPSSQTVEEGGTASYTISLTPQNGFTGTVTLNCADGVPGSTCTITPSSVTLTGTRHATVQVVVPRTAPDGSFTLAFTGTSGTLVHAASVTLKVD